MGTGEDSDVKWFWGWPEKNKCVLGFWRNIYLRSRIAASPRDPETNACFLLGRNNDDVWNHRSVSSRVLITCPGVQLIYSTDVWPLFRNKSKISHGTAESVWLSKPHAHFWRITVELLWHQTRSISCPPREQSAGALDFTETRTQSKAG